MLFELFLAIPIVWLLVTLHYDNYLKISRAKRNEWPSLPTVPFLGSAHLFLGVPSNKLLRLVNKMMTKFCENDRLKLKLGPKLYFFDSNLKDLPIIFNSKNFLEKADEYSLFRNWLQEGLFTSESCKWMQKRKLLKPAFNFATLKTFVSVFDKHSKQMIGKLNTHLQNGFAEGRTVEIDLQEEFSLCSLDIVCETALGVEIFASQRHYTEYIEAVHKASAVVTKRIFNIFYRFTPFYIFTKLAKEERKAVAKIRKLSNKIIRKRLEFLEKTCSIHDTNQPEMRLNCLDLLLQGEINSKSLIYKEIQEEVDTIIFGGFDTTATTLTFLFYNLARYSHNQEKCYEELLEIYGQDKSTKVTYETLNQLPFLECCLKETMRLYPPGPVLGRKAKKDFDLNGFFIPAGSTLVVSPMYLGRSGNLYKDPRCFKPERFEEKNISFSMGGSTSLPFVPFAFGQRSCLGQKFAMLEMKTIAANLLRNFEFFYVGDTDREVRLSFNVTLSTKEKLKFKLKPRQ